jgi:hypothetical protein
MHDKIDVLNSEIIEDITEDLLKIFGSNNNCSGEQAEILNGYITKNECRNILNIIFEALFDEKLKTKNFNYIYKLISIEDDDKVYKKDLDPIIRSFIVCFDVNYITNSSSFNDKVCIKIGKHLLPTTYYIKKSNEG